MPDLQNYVIPESDFKGLHRLAENAQQNEARRQSQEQQAKLRRDGLTKTLLDYADPKERLSGMPTDPEVVKRYGGMMEKGIAFINQNPTASQNDLLMYLSKDAKDLAGYAEGAKVLKNKINKSLEGITDGSGYVKPSLTQKAMQLAWYNEDGTPKPIEQVDPNLNYVALAVEKFPSEVTSNKGIDEWMKGLAKNTELTSVKRYNSQGGFESKKVKATAPAGWVADTDARGAATGKFVPPYEIAYDDGKPVMGKFKDAKGGTVEAPIRMVDEGLFRNIMGNSPATADWVRGQVMQNIPDYKDTDGNPLTLDSPQAMMEARRILYDELKSRNAGSMEEVVESKPTQIRISTGGSGGGSKGSGEVTVRDVYSDIDAATEDPNNAINAGGKRVGTTFNALNADAQEVILKYVNTGRTEKIVPEDLFIHKENGEIKVYEVTKDDNGNPVVRPTRDKLRYTLPRVGANLKAGQPNTAAKVKTVQQGEPNSKPQTTPKAKPTKGKLY